MTSPGAAERPGVRSAVRFSVVVPAYNEEAVLEDCLLALRDQTYPGAFEVLVVDNASTDGTGRLARRAGARVVEEPLRGVCFARQRGFDEAAGEIVVSTDADTVVDPTWLERIEVGFTRRPDTVAVAGPCAYVDGPWWSRVWGRLLFGLVAVVAALTGRVLYVTATNLAFRRDAFEGYDTTLTQGGDELDVLRRLRRRGHVAFLAENTVATSSRRLARGLVHSLVVSLLLHYLLAYAVNRFVGRTVLGMAPAHRPHRLARDSWR